MSRPEAVRCPMCGHLSPAPTGRDFLTCTCGLRLASESGPSTRSSRAKAVFGLFALASLFAAATDLYRRLQ
jgi:hypothetical protein